MTPPTRTVQPAWPDGLLPGSWHRAWTMAGARPADGLLDTLLNCYSEPHRHYHTLQHLCECICHLETTAALAERPAEIELALWFHDACYDTLRQDNEAKSAEWAQAELLAGGAPADLAARVHALIMATRHDAAQPTLPDERLLVDIDLAILGAAPQRFHTYDDQVRAEYAWVPAGLYRRKRKAVLQSFLARPALYGTEHFGTRLEAQARENLAQAVQKLGA